MTFVACVQQVRDLEPCQDNVLGAADGEPKLMSIRSRDPSASD